MALKKFPIGVQDFAQIRENGYFYVDKTDLVYKLTHTNQYYFLSRPRRFGKSLLISTLQCYFEGRKELFAGLAMEKLETEWKKYPVIRLDMSIVKYSSKDSLADSLNKILKTHEDRFGVPSEPENHTWGVRMARIIEEAHKQTGKQVVILVDEYDAPMLDTFGMESFDDIRLQVRSLYSPFKALGGILQFVFLTGISKFSQLSIFSELNNLNVITMDDSYASICGITQEEVLTQMQPEIQALADKQGLTYEGACNALKQKYDGYHFTKNSPDIYNPFSLINALSKSELENFWFSTGTPTILTKLVSKYKMDPEAFDQGFAATQDMFDAPTETAKNPIPMLYQSGYLTIKETKSGNRFVLGFPNDEVRFGFIKALMPYYAEDDVVKNDQFLLKLADLFEENKINEMLTLMKAFISSVPYNLTKQTESYYQALFFIIFKLVTPYVVKAEECSAAGRADAVVETANAVYVFEFKLDGSAEQALKQIDEKGYLIPYSATRAADGTLKKLYKIGVNFDKETRTLGQWVIS